MDVREGGRAAPRLRSDDQGEHPERDRKRDECLRQRGGMGQETKLAVRASVGHGAVAMGRFGA